MVGKVVRLTVAQALVRFLANQMTVIDGEKLPIFAGCWAIFGHGNVAGIGEALYQVRDRLPTYRAHNEQAMAHSADRLRQSELPPPLHGLHNVDRPRRAQHGDGGRGGPRQPAAAPAVAWRRLRQPAARPGAAAGGRLQRRNRVGQRLLPPGVALLRPHQSRRATDSGFAAHHARAHRSRRMRAGDAGDVPGRSGRSLRLAGEPVRREGLGAAPHRS